MKFDTKRRWQKLTFLLLVLLPALTIAGASHPYNQPITGNENPSNKVRVMLKDGRSITGIIQSRTGEMITLSTLSKKEMKKGIGYASQDIHYSQIRSIKVLRFGFLVALILMGAGISLLTWLLLSKSRETNGEDGNQQLGLIVTGPALFIAGIAGLFKKKRYTIDGKRENFVFFLTRVEKYK